VTWLVPFVPSVHLVSQGEVNFQQLTQKGAGSISNSYNSDHNDGDCISGNSGPGAHVSPMSANPQAER
jgi:hypothetical protein